MKRTLSVLLALLLLLPLALAEQAEVSGAVEDELAIVISEGRSLSHGDKGDDVRQLQTRLKDLRYYNGPVTGNYLEVTRKAVRAVQEAYGLETTGIADLDVQAIIYGDAHRPLKKGDSGKDVSRLQTRLSELGYYWGQISGNYLDGTTAAMGNFQEENGLEKTGRADVASLIKLYSDDIVMPTPDPAATVRPVPTAPPDATFNGNVGYGAKSKQVTLIQERLAVLGYFDRKATGGYYEHTFNSVKNFQQHNGLVADGVVGEQTWNVLFSLDVVRAGGIPKPSPAPAPIPYFIEVDVNNQLVKVFSLDDQGGYTKLEKIFWCSTGTRNYPSQPGTYTLTGRRARWAEFPNWGNVKARWWLRIDKYIAFHSVIYNSYDVKSVNTGSVRNLGSRASRGCIRLTVADAKWMYDNIGAGTQVRIHEDAKLDPELKAANKPGSYNSKTYLHNATPAPSQQPAFDSATMPEITRNLKSGVTGEDVFWLQSRLQELGYYSGAITGTYLEGTKNAVRDFQKDMKLNQNGTADRKTLDALAALAPVTTPAPIPLPTDPPGFVVSDLPIEPAVPAEDGDTGEVNQP